MDKKRFRARVGDADAASYPSLLHEAGRRSFLRTFGAGVLAAALSPVAAGCGVRSKAAPDTGAATDMEPPAWDAGIDLPPVDWRPDANIGWPDSMRSPLDGGVTESSPADLPQDLPPQDLPPQDLPPQDLPPQDLPPQDAAADHADLDAGGTADGPRPDGQP